MGYYGGYCMLNRKHIGKVVENVEYYDINSAYPYQMTQELPIGEAIYEKPDFEHLTYHIITIKSGTIKPYLTPIIRNPKRQASLSKNYDIGKFISEVKTPLYYGV